jgi:hypothetical protein
MRQHLLHDASVSFRGRRKRKVFRTDVGDAATARSGHGFVVIVGNDRTHLTRN